MRVLFGYLTFFALCASALPAAQQDRGCSQCLVQNVFDEEPPAEAPAAEQPGPEEDAGKSKSADKRRKRKKSRKKKKPSAGEAEIAEKRELSAQELARQSYVWAPEPGLRLKSTAPGLKPAASETAQRPAAPAQALATPAQPQSFKLPQIPVTQVLIVAAFVVLFLIYRFRVGRQIKRRKY